jgi:hypothetical protein
MYINYDFTHLMVTGDRLLLIKHNVNEAIIAA